ncbi:heparinase II/III domain-containing protein [Dyadobacter tibetensis]|uniref:heparinase II/III domain-containing protein n=1 Tax=Dyadobacter tibetensis TaxID=1211851 RepID=UPI00046FBAE2|nr:heparinase II/III family protein [Dyadobacter tibetensis]
MKVSLRKCVKTGLLAVLWTFSAHAQNFPEPIQNLQRTHPRLLLLKGEEKGIQQKIENHPEWKGVHKAILDECDRMLALPPVERIQIGRRLLDKSRECLRRVFQLSYAYRLTGEEKYFKRAEKELLAVSAFSDWNPSHFLDVAEMTMAAAIGYDWLYDQLSESSRSVIREAIIQKGLEPSLNQKNSSFSRAVNNWNQVCNAGMTFGALAVAEHQPALASQIVDRAIKTLPISMKPSFSPDGAYPEGFAYWDYGTSFNVLLLNAVQKALGNDFGLSESPGFLASATYMTHMVGPTGVAYNWGDSGSKNHLTPALFWFASQSKDASVLWNQHEMLTEAPKNYVNNRLLPAVMLWSDADQVGKKVEPNKLMWSGGGPSPVALMRSSWTDDQAWYLGFKLGSPSVSHAHMDIGSFVVDAQGERWAMDFGSEQYHGLESKGVDLWNKSQEGQRWEVFRLNNRAHNTLTFDGVLQRVAGKAQIDRKGESPENMFAISDLSEIYQNKVKSVRRGVALVNKNAVIIRDEIGGGDKATSVRWNMLTGAQVKILDNQTAVLTKNGKKMRLHVRSKVPVKLQIWSTKPDHDYDSENPNTQFVGFETSVPARASLEVTVELSQNSEPLPAKALKDW